MQITRKGVSTPVEGTLPPLGEKAPHFTLLNQDDVHITNDDFLGNTTIISVFPDINTSVCDRQTRHFFELASKIKDVNIVNLSNNSKEELGDWCATNGIDSVMLRDHDLAFAKDYGLWMPEFKVLARSIFVLDKHGTLIYSELVPEMAQEPNYEAALTAAESLVD